MLDLRIPEPVFWRLSPRQFSLLLNRHLESKEQEDLVESYRAGKIAAAVYNAQRTKESDPWIEPEDVFPHLKEPLGKAREIDQGNQTPEQMLKVARLWQEMMGGAKKRGA